VVCPGHDYAFALVSGRIVTRPKLCGDQQCFPVRVEAGSVYLQLEE